MNTLFFCTNQYIVLLLIKSYMQLFAFMKEKHMGCKRKSYQGLNFLLTIIYLITGHSKDLKIKYN